MADDSLTSPGSNSVVKQRTIPFSLMNVIFQVQGRAISKHTNGYTIARNHTSVMNVIMHLLQKAICSDT